MKKALKQNKLKNEYDGPILFLILKGIFILPEY